MTTIKTSDLRKVPHGLVDFEADGYLLLPGNDYVDCVLGYINFNDGLELTHIFLDHSWSKNGREIEKETITL